MSKLGPTLLERIFIMDVLIKNDKAKNSSYLVKINKVSARTIKRDIKFLRMLGADIVYDKGKGYKYKGMSFLELVHRSIIKAKLISRDKI